MAAPTEPVSRVPRTDAIDGSDASGYFLAVLGPSVQSAYPLPSRGTLAIGRAEDADLRIPDPGISRYHARLHVEEGFRVEDLGSHNGTYVRDRRVPPEVLVPLQPGEVLGLGATLITIQRRLPVLGSQRLGAHAQLEARLIEECAHAEAFGRAFALVRVDLPSGMDAVDAEPALLSVLRPGDLCAVYAPARYEILFVDTDRLVAGDLVNALTARLGPSVAIGTAHCPADGRSPGEIFARACAAVRHASSPASASQEAVVINPTVRELYLTAERAARGTIPILIDGETGVGKELLAAAVHRASPRASKPFLSINCAAVAESVLESELFGHERGAFTGAHSAKEGLFDAASGGTLFLDEVGEMSPGMQAKLLRALETQEIQRVGSTRSRPIDVRLVSATNRNLDEDVEAKRFRRDLYYRLNGITLSLPPLRERQDEIEPIARLVVEKVAHQMDRSAPEIDAEVVALLQQYPWPGNIRELRNTMERAVLLCAGSRITLQHLPEERMRASIERERTTVAPAGAAATDAPAWWARRSEAEKSAISEALARCQGNRTRAAELLGMPRSTFMRKMAENGLIERRGR